MNMSKKYNIYNLINNNFFERNIPDNHFLLEKTVQSCHKNLILNFLTKDLIDLNNVWIITFNMLNHSKDISNLKWIYFSNKAYNYLSWLRPIEIIKIIEEVINRTDNSYEFIKINYNETYNDIEFEKLYTKSFSLNNKKHRIESLVSEIKEKVRYLNQIEKKLEKINNFVTDIYHKEFPAFPFEEIEELYLFSKYLETSENYNIYIKDIKTMVKTLQKYKLGKDPKNLKDSVINWSISLILALREYILSDIEEYQKEIRKLFVI